MSTNNPNNPFSREGKAAIAEIVRQAQSTMEEHPLSAVHINQGSADAMADAYDAEYQASRTMTTPPNAPEKVIADPVTETGEGVLDLMRKVKKSLERFDFWSWAKVQDHAINAVAALLTREAALVARNAELDKLLAESMRQLRREVAGNTELAMEKDALSAENKALRDDAERWREIERRFDRTKTSEAERVLYDLRLPNEDPCKPLAEIIDSARTPAKENLA